MKQVDFVILGFGIAGAIIARELIQRGKRVLVIDSAQNTATAIAGGTIHPTVLRYYTKVWRGDEFWPVAKSHYRDWSEELSVPLITSEGLIRVFDSLDELRLWNKRREQDFWAQYLSPLSLDHSSAFPAIIAPFALGLSDDFLRFNPKLLLDKYRQMLTEHGQYIQSALSFHSSTELYGAINQLGYNTHGVILAQGHQQDFWPGMSQGNPIKAKKGQYLIIECPGLKISRVVKSKFFLIPLGDNRYQVGATYARDKDNNAQEDSLERVKADLDRLLAHPYKVVDCWTGTRPGTQDRKPILGALSPQDNLYVFNGLNSRGLLMAPLLGQWLANYILDDTEFPKEVSISRFF
jgi:glycine/D-amino acid oxidase-like deaminating enzyme